MTHTEFFSDNWAYLRTELNWLDRVLATAIARQRKDVKDVNRVAQSRADQVTSHWWKGLINVEGTIAGDSPAEMPRRSNPKSSYQQQIDSRILATQQRGIGLGLPSLCQKLQLTTLEKNLVLMALAPEISRRYGRIYNFLQETELTAAGLPTIDLILRLLCRTDTEWRTARQCLTVSSKLMQHNVIVLPSSQAEPFLAHPVKVSDSLVEYLLADAPQLATLERLLHTAKLADVIDAPSVALDAWTLDRTVEPSSAVDAANLAATAIAPASTDLWAQLILPASLLAGLRFLGDRIQHAQQVDQGWGFGTLETDHSVGSITLLAGASGTGKTLAARAIAQTLDTSLWCLDLSRLAAIDHTHQLQALLTQTPVVLLLKSAQIWFGRSSLLPPELLRQFLHQRQHSHTITLLSVERSSSLKATWRSVSQTLEFPLPDQASRLQLWQQAFPTIAPLANDIDWQALSRLPLTGKDIQTIAREAALYAVAASEISMKHLLQAYETYFSSSQRRRKF